VPLGCSPLLLTTRRIGSLHSPAGRSLRRCAVASRLSRKARYQAAERAGALSSRNARSGFTEPEARLHPLPPARCPLPSGERAISSQQDVSLSRAKSAKSAASIHYSARVKGGWPPPRFFCGGFPFFTTQKTQKNRGNCSKIVQRPRVGHLGERESTLRRAAPGATISSPVGRWGRGGP
jgi:hypothetical protein